MVFILDNAGINPWISFGFVSIVAGITSFFMRETLGLPLENEIEEEKDRNKNALRIKSENLSKVERKSSD